MPTATFVDHDLPFVLVHTKSRRLTNISELSKGAMILGPKWLGRLRQSRLIRRQSSIPYTTHMGVLEHYDNEVCSDVYYHGRAFIGVCGLRSSAASNGSLIFEQVKTVILLRYPGASQALNSSIAGRFHRHRLTYDLLLDQ